MICNFTLIIALLLSAAMQPQQVTSRITEDDPRWDCHTMGNRICGVVQQQLPKQPPAPPAPTVIAHVFYCGAPTKAGTPCKHRVKHAGERCWQHKAKA